MVSEPEIIVQREVGDGEPGGKGDLLTVFDGRLLEAGPVPPLVRRIELGIPDPRRHQIPRVALRAPDAILDLQWLLEAATCPTPVQPLIVTIDDRDPQED